MTAAEARKYIERFTGWNYAPKLTEAEVDDLVLLARRPDAYGREPTDLNWVETYDVRAAAGIGWEWKLAKVVGGYDFTADGLTVSRSTMIDRIEREIERYKGGSKKTLQSVPVITRTPDVLPYPEQVP